MEFCGAFAIEDRGDELADRSFEGGKHGTLIRIEDIRIAISSDSRGFPINATLIASILRRASVPVHVRCWCRGFLPKSFQQGPLRVEFLPATDEVVGSFPDYVGHAVFDRLRVIREAPDWDRCLIMDYDQVAFCDLAPLFTMDLGDRLLAAKWHGPGVDLAHAMREWLKSPIPQGWEHAAGNPYFSMGPLLNLAEMRKAGTWEKLLAAQEAFRADENLALVAATEGRTMDFDPKWNLFVPHDVENSELPGGVVHWLGWPKPWHEDAKVWRPELWEAERCSWEQLRLGLWEKPLAVEVEPDDDYGVENLLKRGWKVKWFTGWKGMAAEELPALRYPDLAGEAVEDFAECWRANGSGEAGVDSSQRLERVRFGSWGKAS
jgi:lipopolysaccharide biosynthesis glycosyltransferase